MTRTQPSGQSHCTAGDPEDDDGSRRAAIPHVDALDGARGMAVAGVLLFHGGHLQGGYLGVDLFFTLSGFLITSLLLAEAGRSGGVGLGGFWARRARRLLPALVVLLVGVAVYTRLVAAPDQVSRIRGDVFATFGYVANWHEIFSHQSYFSSFAAPSPLAHTWSLAIEEQFYVIWPVFFVAVCARWRRATPKAVLVTSLVLAGVSGALMIALYHPGDVSRVYFGTDTRSAAILLGAALAAWLSIHGPTKSRRRRVALETTGLAAVVVLAIAWTRLDGQSPALYRGGFVLCGLAATAIIAAIVHPEPGLLSRVLSFRPLCALGLISYGVYLYHWPLDIFLDEQRVGFGGWPLFAFRTAVTLAVAVASYRVLEQPIRHGVRARIELRMLIPAGAVAVALIVGLVAVDTNTSPTHLIAVTFDPRITAAGAAPRARRETAARTASRTVPRPAPSPAPPVLARVMLVGNSVAYRLAQAMQQLDAHPPLTVINDGIPACTFPPQVKVPSVWMPNGSRLRGIPCDPPSELQLARRSDPQVVFWVESNPMGTGGTYLGRHIEPCSSTWNSLYAESLREEVVALRTTGAKVVITTAAYSRFMGVRFNDRATDCDNQVRRQVATETGAQLIDLFTYICRGGRCRTGQDGVLLRPDGLHYAGPGGELVARWLLEQVR